MYKYRKRHQHKQQTWQRYGHAQSAADGGGTFEPPSQPSLSLVWEQQGWLYASAATANSIWRHFIFNNDIAKFFKSFLNVTFAYSLLLSLHKKKF